MQTLSHGVQLPENGDDGSVWFPALALALQILNDHTHNGSDANKIAVIGQVALKQTPTITWDEVTPGSGLYETTVGLPGLLTAAAHTFETLNIQIRDTAGEILYVDFKKVTSTTFKVFSNDNTLAFEVIYSA